MLCAAGCPKEQPKGLSDEAKRDAIEAMYREYKKSFPETPDVRVEQVVAWQTRKRVVLLDARGPRERQVSIIPGAISAEEFEKGSDKRRKDVIVAYCTIGYRSGLLAADLRERGFDAYNLKGGILAWVHAGRKIVDGRGETKRVHVYAPKWNLVPEGYEAVR